MKGTREVLRGIDAALLDNDRARIEERVERVLASACDCFLHHAGIDEPLCRDGYCRELTEWKHSGPFISSRAVAVGENALLFPDLYGAWLYTEAGCATSLTPPIVTGAWRDRDGAWWPLR